MKKIFTLIVLVLIIGIALAIYSANRNKTSGNQPSPAQMTDMSSPSQISSATSAATQSSGHVTIKGFAFTPANISVKKGTTVTWTNQDNSVHTVTETDGKTGPKSDSLSQGQTYSFTYNEAGTFPYHCSFHSSMTGTVTVTD